MRRRLARWLALRIASLFRLPVVPDGTEMPAGSAGPARSSG
jgi:hypothetical protein